MAIKTIEVNNEEEAREWCDIHGYTFRSCYLAGNYICEYDDGQPEPLSAEEEKYYEDMIATEEKNEEVKDYIIYSEERGMSTLYKGFKPNEYIFDRNQAKRYTKDDAEKKAKYMTKHSKSGRVWCVCKY